MVREISVPRWGVDRWQRVAVGAIAIVVLWRQRVADLKNYDSWQGWADQDHYLASARAWAAWNLDAGKHHYPPGYSLLGALFAHLTPAQPFLLPDLACVVASLLLFVRIAAYLLPELPAGQVLAALCFLVATTLLKACAVLWAVPWTTTVECPLLLLSLLLALRFGKTLATRDAALLGFAGGLGALVRPGDSALVLALCGGFCAWRVAIARPGWRVALMCAGSLAAGTVAGLLPALGLHLAMHGLTAGAYGAKSAGIGFEPRLIGLRFSSIVIDPRPLFSGYGMVTVFPWIIPGVAGMILGCLPRHGPGRAAAANILVASSVAFYCALYFAYRDLNAPGFWRFSNVHYFKWVLPFLLLWAVGLLVALWQRERRGAVAFCLAAALLLFAWRPEVIWKDSFVEAASGRSAPVPGGLSPLGRVVFVQATGDWLTLYTGASTFSAVGQLFHATVDFKLFPSDGGVMIVPLRPLPAGDGLLTLPDGAGFPPQVAVRTGVWRVAFRLPCFVSCDSR
jgi:hypothetical protein